jgi:hypothetical protein
MSLAIADRIEARRDAHLASLPAEDVAAYHSLAQYAPDTLAAEALHLSPRDWRDTDAPERARRIGGAILLTERRLGIGPAPRPRLIDRLTLLFALWERFVVSCLPSAPHFSDAVRASGPNAAPPRGVSNEISAPEAPISQGRDCGPPTTSGGSVFTPPAGGGFGAERRTAKNSAPFAAEPQTAQS